MPVCLVYSFRNCSKCGQWEYIQLCALSTYCDGKCFSGDASWLQTTINVLPSVYLIRSRRQVSISHPVHSLPSMFFFTILTLCFLFFCGFCTWSPFTPISSQILSIWYDISGKLETYRLVLHTVKDMLREMIKQIRSAREAKQKNAFGNVKQDKRWELCRLFRLRSLLLGDIAASYSIST